MAGTLARTKTGLKCDFIKPACKKHQMSFLKKGAKIHLKNERKINRQTPPKLLSNVRSKSRPKRGPKGTSKSKKSRKTSKSEIENWPKKGQKWTSKTAPKLEGRDPPRIHLKLTTNRPEIDFKVKIGPVY